MGLNWFTSRFFIVCHAALLSEIQFWIKITMLQWIQRHVFLVLLPVKVPTELSAIFAKCFHKFSKKKTMQMGPVTRDTLVGSSTAGKNNIFLWIRSLCHLVVDMYWNDRNIENAILLTVLFHECLDLTMIRKLVFMIRKEFSRCLYFKMFIVENHRVL